MEALVSIVLTAVLLSVFSGPAQHVQGTYPCESNPDCCPCVKTPGCSWFSPPTVASPYCADTPFGDMSRNDTMQRPELTIRRNVPINYSRRRLIAPQVVGLKANLGVSETVLFRVMSRSRHISLQVNAPRDELELDVFQEFSWTCDPGLGRQSGSSNRRGRRRRQQRFGITCQTSAPGETIGLVLRVTVKKCFQRSKVVRVRPVMPGERMMSLRVHVTANCRCPSETPTSASGAPRAVETCVSTADEAEELKIDCMNRAWSGSCQHGQDQAFCNGNGACLCGLCVCHNTNTTNLGNRTFTGEYCGCDDSSCPRSHSGMVCGGPQHGMCQCGNCVCRPGWVGQACDCNQNAGECPRDSDGRVCSNHGLCVCGECRCEDGYSGVACQCSRDSCPRSSSNGLPCGGPDRGECECGQCLCIGPRLGQACDDDISNIPPISRSYSPCSGRGVFRRGRCVCEQPYGGDQCELCATCSNSCQDYRTCVTCQALPFVSGSPQCASCPANPSPNAVEYRAVHHLPDEGRLCVFRHNSCSIEFSYQTTEAGSTLVYYNSNILIRDGSRTSAPTEQDCN